jgi:hypothetical protein
MMSKKRRPAEAAVLRSGAWYPQPLNDIVRESRSPEVTA